MTSCFQVKDFVIAKSNQSEGGSVVKLRLVVDLFAVESKINLIKKDCSYSVLAMESRAMFCER